MKSYLSHYGDKHQHVVAPAVSGESVQPETDRGGGSGEGVLRANERPLTRDYRHVQILCGAAVFTVSYQAVDRLKGHVTWWKGSVRPGNNPS